MHKVWRSWCTARLPIMKVPSFGLLNYTHEFMVPVSGIAWVQQAGWLFWWPLASPPSKLTGLGTVYHGQGVLHVPSWNLQSGDRFHSATGQLQLVTRANAVSHCFHGPWGYPRICPGLADSLSIPFRYPVPLRLGPRGNSGSSSEIAIDCPFWDDLDLENPLKSLGA